uniref:Uncharacterized protein n=1 Tax=Rhizophora mucronata TaxID=61149 RepID=A0A2P2NTN7_RHIMU
MGSKLKGPCSERSSIGDSYHSPPHHMPTKRLQ